jgi:hypothetical protein
MPLRIDLALKHNQKADPPFPRAQKKPETVTQKSEMENLD